MMQIIVNAKPHEVTSATLTGALSELGFTGSAIATALNGQFIPREARDSATLSDGDRLEVLAPMQGG